MFSLERAGMLFRLDKSLTPTRNRLATVSTLELGHLRKVKNIIRKGRLRAVTGRVVFFQQIPKFPPKWSQTDYIHPKSLLSEKFSALVTGSGFLFLSGEEVALKENSLVVDCSVNGIKFKPKTQIFQGNQIILQYIMLPPFGDFFLSLKTTFQVFIV